MKSGRHMGKRGSQQGFTLVFVLILLLMASVIVFKTIQSNIQQERTSGNMRKQINAQIAAEQGIYSVYAALQQLLTVTNDITDADDLIEAVEDNGIDLTGEGSVAGSGFTVVMNEDSGTIELVSTGSSFESIKAVSALISFSGGGTVSTSPYISAVTGCNGVSLQGSGLVDSFDSTLGNYSSSIADSNATVSTINPGASIELQGNSPIYGNVVGTGSVTLLGSSPVVGNIHANGDVSILGGNGKYPYRVSGWIKARGNYQQASVTVYGDVETDGDATLTWSSEITTGVLKYAGSLSVPVWWNGDTSGFENIDPVIPEVANSASTDPDTYAECDPLDVLSTMAGFQTSEILPDLIIGPWKQRNYLLTPTSGVFTDNAAADTLSPEEMTVAGNKVSAYRVSSLSVSQNGTLDISGGDVIVYIENDFSMHGGVELTIEAGSSLTLYIEGEFSFTGGAISVQQHGMTDSGVPALSVYSSYVSQDSNDIGVELGGASDIYAVVYAPYASVDITGSGEIFGAIIGDTVQVTGAGEVHYDEALSDSTIPSETRSGEVTINLDGLYSY